MRVQAKVHPDIKWVAEPVPDATGDGRLGGAGKALREGVRLEELPPGPTLRQ